MKNVLIIILGLIYSLSSFGQGATADRTISLQDSSDLHHFWTVFQNAVANNDKTALAGLCEFPFYCKPCIGDTTLKNNDQATIKVTRKLFYESQYKVFFENPVKNAVKKQQIFATNIFYPAVNNKNKRNGFVFSYPIIAPSKKWEGLQGFIYLNKKRNTYKITGIDTVP
ncbi:MAG: hypothetical protein QM802_12210 [Agriterribacter sp.]